MNFVNWIFFSTFDASASTRSGFSKPRSRKLDPLALLPEASGLVHQFPTENDNTGRRKTSLIYETVA
jgi:hypothetical protein